MEIVNLASDAAGFTGNVWLLSNSENVLVDAGTGESWDAIKELDAVDRVVITHSHYDHVDNLPRIVDMFSPEVYAFEPGNLPVNDVNRIRDGEKLELCGVSFTVFHTPGHRDDSVCLYSEESGVLFTGDLVFPDGGFGRTDLDQGDRDALIESIESVAELDVGEMYSGHGKPVRDVDSDIERSLAEARKREPKY